MATPFPPSSGAAPTRAVNTGSKGPDEGTNGTSARTGCDTPSLHWRPAPAAPSPGDRLGAYRLDREVGQGGMGVVYLGLDDEHRAVALKVLKPHIAADPHARARLAREVATLERVRSPRVAEVLSADVDGPWPHLVTRYVPGPSLDAVVEGRGPLRGKALRDLGHGLAEALAAIHAAGVVHRDLKPSNVLLLDGLPVVIDFGIAHVADDVRLTSTGLVMGTPGYLSPEVVVGGHVSPATDWWGWAATVAYAASGRPPFGKGPMEVVLDRVRRADVDLSAVPADLRGPILAALAVDPAHRPHPDHLLRALDGATTAPQPVVAAAAETITLSEDAPRPAPAGVAPSRFASIISSETISSETQSLPTVAHPHARVEPSVSTGAPQPPVESRPESRPGSRPESPRGGAADSTRLIPPAATPSTVTLPGERVQQAPAGWIPASPGPRAVPGRVGADPSAPSRGAPAGYPPLGRPAQQGAPPPPLGINGEPARPQRNATLSCAALALVGVIAVAPTAGLIIALVAATIFRTVDRAAAGLFRRRWEAGPRATDAWAIGAATPWHAVRAAVSTAFAAIIPLLVGVSVVFILGLFGQGQLLDPGSPLVLASGGLAGVLVAWHGPGGRSLQRGTRTAVRATLRGERAT
ncbi:MAG: protein kinase domain-containing protein, partial [Janthinobacterium lividum]